MSKKRETPSGMFMMEMIMVVFFFILCASTCILVFVKANNMSRLAQDTSQSVLKAESIAEVWKAEGESGLEERLGALPDGGKYRIFWDRDWENVKEAAGAAYRADIVISGRDAISQADIVIDRAEDGSRLFSLSAEKYEQAVTK